MDDLTISKPATEQETQVGLVHAGQRKVNLIWEYTQSIIALSVVVANLIVFVHAGMSSKTVEVPAALSNSLFLVIGFYFSRTNHTAIGGVGFKPNTRQDYEGR